jgi:hypothetical protein
MTTEARVPPCQARDTAASHRLLPRGEDWCRVRPRNRREDVAEIGGGLPTKHRNVNRNSRTQSSVSPVRTIVRATEAITPDCWRRHNLSARENSDGTGAIARVTEE